VAGSISRSSSSRLAATAIDAFVREMIKHPAIRFEQQSLTAHREKLALARPVLVTSVSQGPFVPVAVKTAFEQVVTHIQSPTRTAPRSVDGTEKSLEPCTVRRPDSPRPSHPARLVRK
jgi:hypothetical protein